MKLPSQRFHNVTQARSCVQYMNRHLAYSASELQCREGLQLSKVKTVTDAKPPDRALHNVSGE